MHFIIPIAKQLSRCYTNSEPEILIIHLVICLFEWFNGIVRPYAIRPHRAAEKLKGFLPSLSFFLQQLLEDRVLKSLITCGAVGREIIACL